MDRQIVYPGSIPLDTDFLQVQRNVMIALGVLTRAVFGTDLIVDGLACAPGAGLAAVVGPGSITTFSVVDQAAFGSLGVDSRGLCKTGQVLVNTPLMVQAPAAGVQVWLVEAQLAEVDGGPVALPYYNAGSPSIAWSGPGNSGAAQNTQRSPVISLRVRAGVPRGDGTQVAPAPVAGWIALHAVSVTAGQTQLRPQDFVAVSDAPVLQYRLPQLTPGFSRQSVITSSSTWVVPAGVRLARVRVTGGGGGGGGSDEGAGDGFSGGGGGAGGYAESVLRVTPGAAIPVLVGLGGSGSGPRITGSVGGASAFGPYGASGELRALGGGGGGSNNADSRGGSGGVGISGAIILAGGYGSDGVRLLSVPGGSGGASAWGGGGRGAYLGGGPAMGQAPGSGGGGSYGASSAGGAGAVGLVVIDY